MKSGMKVLNFRSNKNSAPNPENIEYGELAINYSTSGETIYIKNDSDEIVEFDPIKRDEINSLSDRVSENEHNIEDILALITEANRLLENV